MTDTDSALQEVTDGDIEKGMNTILPGKDPLNGMEAFHEGGVEYTVLSQRNGSPSVHWVELGKVPTCTCNDYQGNRKGSFDGEMGSEREPCAHIVKAVLADTLSPEELSARELINVTATMSKASAEAREAAAEARDTAQALDNGLVNVRDAEAGQAASNGSNTNSQSNGSDSTTNADTSHSDDGWASEAAEELQEAFDNVVKGMEVEDNQGMVWVNKTPAAPDTLPGPGNVEIFSSFLQEPSQVQYVHDNHDYAGAEPGQYFSNMIDPSDVEGYINEVLK